MKQSRQTDQTVTFECDVITETDRAVLLKIAGQKKSLWFPKSMVQYHEEGLMQEVEMPRGLAIEKGLL